MLLFERKDCPMRHENGNCTVAGGFCTAVSDPICEALHNAYYCGRDSISREDLIQCAEWLKDRDGDEYCSKCSRYMPSREVTGDPSANNFCPECGAEMKKPHY